MITQFFKKSSLLLLLVLISTYGLSYMVDAGLHKSRNSYYATWNDLYNSKINADLLVMGSSRAEFHISPKILDSVLSLNTYNLGLSAWHFDMQYARFRMYLQHNRKPKYIIQNVDVYGFSKRQDVIDYQQFLPYIQDTILQKTIVGHKGEFDIFQRNIPLWKYKNDPNLAFEGFFNFAGNTAPYDTTTKFKGYQGNNYVWNQDFERFKKRYPKGAKYRFDKEVLRQFNEFLALCKRENIKVFLVYAPEYYEVQTFYKNKGDLIKLCHKSALKYDCQFLDYSKDSLCYDRQYFYNSQHLNKRGAEIFSLELSQAIKVKYFKK
ncbi:MAG: hypothetical protein U5N85_00850 [Arcicella sp.]|nr:hypothetical protein [Arcicella sp.]